MKAITGYKVQQRGPSGRWIGTAIYTSRTEAMADLDNRAATATDGTELRIRSIRS